MPDFIRNILLVSDESLDKLASMPDKIHEIKSEKEMCAVLPNVNYNDAFIARIAVLEQKIDSMKINDYCRFKFRSHHQNISHSQPFN